MSERAHAQLIIEKKKCLGGGEDLKPWVIAVGYTLGKLIGKERYVRQ